MGTSPRISLNTDSVDPTYHEQKEPSASHKTLGAFKNMMGKEDEHILYVKKAKHSQK
jgi:hypothetical protein